MGQQVCEVRACEAIPQGIAQLLATSKPVSLATCSATISSKVATLSHLDSIGSNWQ